MDDAISEIGRLPGRHLYFLDDHLLGHRRFATDLFREMQSIGRIFRGAATVDSILRGDLIEKAADAGLRSIFIGFESLNPDNLKQTNKKQNINRDYDRVINRLHELGIMINGSFVFGLDSDDSEVFKRTVDWAVKMYNNCHVSYCHPLSRYRVLSQNAVGGTSIDKRLGPL